MDNSVVPIVSIACITFNQEKYIKEAIEGFLMQKTAFPIEIIIHDDASTDKTPIILQEYAELYPKLIIPIFQQENQFSKGINPGFTYVFPRCKGKYIAVCECDDFWTDPLKLQKQVDLMEASPELSLCFHNAIIKYEGKKGKDELYFKNPINKTLNIQDIIKGIGMPTASMLFRRVALETPEWFMHVYNGDYALQLILANNGNIGYLDEIMSVYRKQPGGLNTTMKNAKVHQHIISLLSYFNIYTNFKYSAFIDTEVARRFDEYPFQVLHDKSRLERILSIEYLKRKLGFKR